MRDKLKYENMNKISKLNGNAIDIKFHSKEKKFEIRFYSIWRIHFVFLVKENRVNKTDGNIVASLKSGRKKNFLAHKHTYIAFYACNSFNKMKMVTEPRFKLCSSALAKLSKVREEIELKTSLSSMQSQQQQQ